MLTDFSGSTSYFGDTTLSCQKPSVVNPNFIAEVETPDLSGPSSWREVTPLGDAAANKGANRRAAVGANPHYVLGRLLSDDRPAPR